MMKIEEMDFFQWQERFSLYSQGSPHFFQALPSNCFYGSGNV